MPIKISDKSSSRSIRMLDAIFPSKHRQLDYQIASSSGFTIVELLVVIVVIGILAAITIVSYTGITQRATVSSLQSDLTSASNQLKLYYQLYGTYPTAMAGNCPTAPTADSIYCIKASSGNTLNYTSVNPSTFHLTDTSSTNSYAATDNTSPAIATTPTGSLIGSACPSGFIPVPGSGTYGTNDFCVMKYAASHSDATAIAQGASTVPISTPGVQQWVNISQITAMATAPNVANCTGCHLITEAEWMTIAQNVLSVASNWSGGSVGSGYIYSGHNDAAPNNALVPDPSDANGYAGETNIGGNQKRTLTLTNGQVIWDMAGNIYEWTAGQTNGTTAQQPGVAGNNYTSWIEWPTLTTNGTLPISPLPSSTGLAGSNTWNSSKGVGMLVSSTTDAGLYGFVRSGFFNSGNTAGVLLLTLPYPPPTASVGMGFRVSR